MGLERGDRYKVCLPRLEDGIGVLGEARDNMRVRATPIGLGSPHIDAEMLAEPIPFDCEHIVDSGFGWLITMEK